MTERFEQARCKPSIGMNERMMATKAERICQRKTTQTKATTMLSSISFLTIHTQLRFWCSPITRERHGQLAGEFLVLYAVVRAIGEIFREPDASLFFGISRGMFYSIFLVVGGLILIVTNRRKSDRSPKLDS